MCVIDNFVDTEVAVKAREEVQTLFNSPCVEFRKPKCDQEAIRSDLLCWLEGYKHTPHIKQIKVCK